MNKAKCILRYMYYVIHKLGHPLESHLQVGFIAVPGHLHAAVIAPQGK